MNSLFKKVGAVALAGFLTTTAILLSGNTQAQEARR